MIYKTFGTCSRAINFEVKDGVIQSVEFVGGCDGNTQGLSRLLVGMSVDGAIKRLSGIDCGGKRARKITRVDCAHFDYILCMEDRHVRSVLRLCGEKEKEKVHRLSDYTDHPHDIADPWYTRDFTAAYGDIRAGVTAFLDSLQEKTSHS